MRPSDLDEHNILHIRRAIYERKVVEFEPHEYERIPLDTPVHAELVRRMPQLGEGTSGYSAPKLARRLIPATR